MILNEEILEEGQCTVKVMAEACWANKLGNPKDEQFVPLLLQPLMSSFVNNYQHKYKKRRLKVMGLYGSVELCLDKKHNFEVSTA
jgi:hypothetical protein